ncbi:MAG: SO2930 family diheme c-type cytochrome [Cytophagales bacterium]|nr:SO2930 family diheme c-type cytochrome [Cytophagales bacterium]
MKLVCLLAAVLIAGCVPRKPPAEVVLAEEPSQHDLSAWGKEKLSGYSLFIGALKNFDPAPDVFPYDINSPLFSDYAYKRRFIKIPPGSTIGYDGAEVFHFPEGTILVKNFYYPADFRNPEKDIRVLETRLLILEGETWKALTYVWNEAQDEAVLELGGSTKRVAWTHYNGSAMEVNYSIPDVNQCKSCHLKGDKTMPIGLSARQLNKKKQLTEWVERGWITELPPVVPRLVAYEDLEAPIDDRARAWLEINCAHCHRPDGQAKTSGLHLMATVNSLRELGLGKAPVAAGKGSGGRMFSIVPGRPDASILVYRIESTDPGVMMPEMGRKLVHTEGVAVVRAWIREMKPVN